MNTMFRCLFSFSFAVFFTVGHVTKNDSTCYVYPDSIATPGVDDAPTILSAFDMCGHQGDIVLTANTFHVESVMNTTNLQDCNVHLYGEMVWGSDISYWLQNSYSALWNGRSTAWLFGGDNVTFQGHGIGRFNGNGQSWYDQNMNNGNQPGRPIAITFYQATNLFVDGLTWEQPQFWASFISHSSNVVMTNITINATSNSEWSTVNTDGTDTWNSDNIYLEKWVVTNGDDCIAIKGNSTNIHIKNIACYGSNGNGIPIGSIGQDPQVPEFVENILIEDVVLYGSDNAAWVKIFSDTTQGHVRNVTWRNFECNNVNLPIAVTQCIYTDDPSSCDSSKMQISDLAWENFRGTSQYNVAAAIRCSGSAPCENLHFRDVNIAPSAPTSPNQAIPHYLCANIANQDTGSDIGCDAPAPPSMLKISEWW